MSLGKFFGVYLVSTPQVCLTCWPVGIEKAPPVTHFILYKSMEQFYLIQELGLIQWPHILPQESASRRQTRLDCLGSGGSYSKTHPYPPHGPWIISDYSAMLLKFFCKWKLEEKPHNSPWWLAQNHWNQMHPLIFPKISVNFKTESSHNKIFLSL